MSLTMAYFRKIHLSCCSARYVCCPQFHTSGLSSMRLDGTAGVIVTGDEILKGQVADTNSHFIAKHMFDIGVRVKRISVIGDEENEIAKEVQDFSNKFSYVITTGGIGPTHDDVTFSAVAKAFGEKLVPHPELVKICADFFHTKDLNSPAMKLAHVPESAKLTYGYDKIKGRRTLYPNVSVHNVYIFPGIPDLMERLFLAVYKDLFNKGLKKLHSKNVYVSSSEVTFTDYLNAIVTKYPNVQFGSYPKLFNRYYQVQLTIQSDSEEETENAYRDLVALLPKENIVPFDSTPANNAYKKILNISTRRKEHIRDAINMVEQMCKLCRSSEICVVFNGDPASVVVTHLVHAYLRKDLENTKFHGVNFITGTCSSESEQFIMDTQASYNMKLETLSGSLDITLKSFVDSHPHLKTIFVGYASHTTSEMIHLLCRGNELYPTIKWVNPLEKWTTSDVWDFIYSLYLPYNTYYDSNK